LIDKKVTVREKSIGKNFGDDLDDSVEEINRLKFIDQRSTFFFRMRAIKA